MDIVVVRISINNDLKPPRAQVRVNLSLSLTGATLIRCSFERDELLEIRLNETRDWDSAAYARLQQNR
jgi:hypothetical protein